LVENIAPRYLSGSVIRYERESFLAIYKDLSAKPGTLLQRGIVMALTTAAQQIIIKAGMAGQHEIPQQYWELVERYRGELSAQAFAILGSHEDAEDAVQETFLEMVRNPERIKHIESLSGWLKSINRDNALNRIRSRSRAARKSERRKQDVSGESSTTGGFSMLELRDSVAQTLQTLPPELQAIVKLRYFEHLSYKEIATRLKIDEGAVERRLVRASKELFPKLKPLFPRAAPNGGGGRD
jgi:RNA polymerase sigma-70 factor (ECF subfamily)